MISELNVWLRELCKKRGLIYLDYFSALADDKGLMRAGLSKDGLHPNDKGYAIMTPLAAAAIKTALRTRHGR